MLECRDVAVRYGDFAALSGVDMSVAAGETLALLGPSGSGKSTLLYAIAGFLDIAGGSIVIDGAQVATAKVSAAPESRAIGFVFQNYALWPHLTAVETVAYPLRRTGAAKSDARREALELLAKMDIAELADRKPAELSGGQQQRVALARALARSAKVLLLDEPTAHLDAALRASVQAELDERMDRATAAVVYATHDAAEALATADHVVVLREGVSVQVGTPQDIYERPADRWVARLTGPVSSLTAETELDLDGRLVAAIGPLRIPLDGPARVTGTVDVLVRPDWVVLDPPQRGMKGEVRKATYRGPHTDVEVTTPHGVVAVRTPGSTQLGPGDSVELAVERAWAPPTP